VASQNLPLAGTRERNSQALPTPERTRIEALKPYQGGNDLLWSLHQLDILRKHQRLLGVATNPGRFHITGWGLSQHFVPIATGWMWVNDRETAVGLIAHGAPSYEMKFSAYITLSEAALSAPKPIVATLNEFANLAHSIINLFDAWRVSHQLTVHADATGIDIFFLNRAARRDVDTARLDHLL
jgi:hypothetical protein